MARGLNDDSYDQLRPADRAAPARPGIRDTSACGCRLAEAALGKGAEPPAVSAISLRLLAWLTILAAGAVGQFAVVLTCLLAIAQAAPPLTAAAGASAVAAAAVAWRDHPMWMS